MNLHDRDGCFYAFCTKSELTVVKEVINYREWGQKKEQHAKAQIFVWVCTLVTLSMSVIRRGLKGGNCPTQNIDKIAMYEKHFYHSLLVNPEKIKTIETWHLTNYALRFTKFLN